MVLGSYDDRAHADARRREVQNQGVEDAGLLDQEEYDLGSRWSVYSAQFEDREQAEAHRQEHLGTAA